MGIWQKSDLYIGEDLKMPDDYFESSEAKYRLISSRFIGETENGIRIQFVFKPLLGSEENISYEAFINWNSIYCGAIKIVRTDGSLVRARRTEESNAK